MCARVLRKIFFSSVKEVGRSGEKNFVKSFLMAFRINSPSSPSSSLSPSRSTPRIGTAKPKNSTSDDGGGNGSSANLPSKV